MSHIPAAALCRPSRHRLQLLICWRFFTICPERFEDPGNLLIPSLIFLCTQRQFPVRHFATAHLSISVYYRPEPFSASVCHCHSTIRRRWSIRDDQSIWIYWPTSDFDLTTFYLLIDQRPPITTNVRLLQQFTFTTTSDYSQPTPSPKWAFSPPKEQIVEVKVRTITLQLCIQYLRSWVGLLLLYSAESLLIISRWPAKSLPAQLSANSL